MRYIEHLKSFINICQQVRHYNLVKLPCERGREGGMDGGYNSMVLNYFTLAFLFRFIFDAMHAVTGAYAKPIFVEKLGASLVCCACGIF